MKKITKLFVAGLLCFAMAMPASAQLKWGVKGGLNLSSIDLGAMSATVKENSTGFFIGPMAEFTIPLVGLGVDGALMYSQRGSDDAKQSGIEIPVNLKYTIGLGSTLGLYLAAGPDFFFNFSDLGDGLKRSYDKKNTQVGLSLGAGLKLVRHLQLGVNYILPMGDSFTLKNAGSAVTGKSDGFKTWQVSLAYMF